MGDDITNQSAVSLAAAIRSGELGSVEVVTAHLDRIDELNPQVNAIVARRDRADVLADAAANACGQADLAAEAVADVSDEHAGWLTTIENFTAAEAQSF